MPESFGQPRRNPCRYFCRWSAALVALAFLSSAASAQDVQQITFNDAVRIALDNNVQLRRAANTVRAQENAVRSSRAAFLPSLNLSTGSSRYYGLNFDQITGDLVTFSSDRVSLSAFSSITLFQGFREFAALAQARMDLTASDLTHERQRQTVVFLVMTQFLDLIQSRESIAIQEENLAAQQQLLTQVDEFVRVGTRPMADLYQQQAQTANAELLLLDAERSVRLAETRLIQTLYLDPYGTYEFVSPDLSEMPLVPEAFEIDGLLTSAFERRLDLRAQESRIGASEQGIRFARGSRLPSVSFSGSAGTSYSSAQRQRGFGPDAQIVPFADQFRDNRSQNIGLNLQLPLFNRLRTRAQVQQAQISLNNAQLDLDNLRHDIAVEVRQAYLEYVNDEKNLDVTEIQLQSAEQALQAEQERYNVGASTLVELSQARANYVRSLSDRSNARFNFLFRKRLIEYYTGVLDPGRPLFE